MRDHRIKALSTAFLMFLLLFTACSDDGDDENDGATDPTFIGIYGVITDAVDTTPVYPALITIINEATQQMAVEPFLVDTNGAYRVELPDGVYQVRTTAQGYEPKPALGTPATPVSVLSDSVIYDVALTPTTDSGTGWIEGVIDSFSDTLGALVTLIPIDSFLDDDMVSTITTDSGQFVLFNIAAGTYEVVTALAGYTTQIDTVTVIADEAAELTIPLTATTGATVSGTVTFRATTGIVVDVSLIDTLTGLIIPGLTTYTVDAGGAYTIENVPDGFYLARASYAIDERVLDPDWVIKFGEPTVSVVDSVDVERNFSCTDAVLLTYPIVDDTLLTTPEIDTTVPTFSWTAYPSTSDYVIEVRNDDGEIIWGGFNEDFTNKNITIPSGDTAIVFNEDSTATENLEDGKTYRWKVYASKNDQQSATGWKLISMSEEAQGVFKVVIPVTDTTSDSTAVDTTTAP